MISKLQSTYCNCGSGRNCQYLCIAQKCQLYRKCCYSCAHQQHAYHKTIAYATDQFSNLFGKNVGNREMNTVSFRQKLQFCKEFFPKTIQKLKQDFQQLKNELNQTLAQLLHPLEVLENTLRIDMREKKLQVIQNSQDNRQLSKIAKQLRNVQSIQLEKDKWVSIMIKCLDKNVRKLQTQLSQQVKQIKQQLKSVQRLSQFGSGMQENIKSNLYEQLLPKQQFDKRDKKKQAQEIKKQEQTNGGLLDDSKIHQRQRYLNEDDIIYPKRINQNSFRRYRGQVDYNFIFNVPGIRHPSLLKVDISSTIEHLQSLIQGETCEKINKLDWKINKERKITVTSTTKDKKKIIKDFIDENNIQAEDKSIELQIQYQAKP